MIKIIELATMCERSIGKDESSVLCLGNFDGVHLAHAELIKRTRTLAQRLGRELKTKILSGAFFFSDHPSERLSDNGDALLTPLSEKLEIFRSLGLDIAVVADFEELMNMPPDVFVHEILMKRCASVGAVCGYNFRFGKGGVGYARDLSSLFSKDRCEIVGEIKIDGHEISSSAIRSALKRGDVKMAALLLGRCFCAQGKVECASDGTALARFSKNIAVPKDGKYRVTLLHCGKKISDEINVFTLNEKTFCGPLCKEPEVGSSIKIVFEENIG